MISGTRTETSLVAIVKAAADTLAGNFFDAVFGTTAGVDPDGSATRSRQSTPDAARKTLSDGTLHALPDASAGAFARRPRYRR